MGTTVAAGALQVHGTGQLKFGSPQPDDVAGLVGPGRDRNLLAAVLQHLRHEDLTLGRARLVEGGQNLFAAPHTHRLAPQRTERTALELAGRHWMAPFCCINSTRLYVRA